MKTFERDTLTKKDCRREALDYAKTIFESKLEADKVDEIMAGLKQFTDFMEILDYTVFAAIENNLATWAKNDAVRLEIDAMEDNLLVACKAYNC